MLKEGTVQTLGPFMGKWREKLYGLQVKQDDTPLGTPGKRPHTASPSYRMQMRSEKQTNKQTTMKLNKTDHITSWLK
jgi:hypothetical protein